ncbi:MAG: hypothetical protein AAGA35_03390 [Patescibacteria group bacterium]
MFFCLAILILPTTAISDPESGAVIAQAGDPPTDEFRKVYDEHYYSGECCFCGVVDSFKTISENEVEVTIGGSTYTVPNKWKGPAPERPDFKGTIVCDPVTKQYPCLIGNVGI